MLTFTTATICLSQRKLQEQTGLVVREDEVEILTELHLQCLVQVDVSLSVPSCCHSCCNQSIFFFPNPENDYWQVFSLKDMLPFLLLFDPEDMLQIVVLNQQ